MSAHAEAFVFTTRPTWITRALAHRQPDVAFDPAGRAAPDWSGGTRLGEPTRASNDLHGCSAPLLARVALLRLPHAGKVAARHQLHHRLEVDGQRFVATGERHPLANSSVRPPGPPPEG